MVRLDAGNVLLKPSQRRMLMSCLRRSLRLGERLGNFILDLSVRRIGHHYQVQAVVKDSIGSFRCHCRCSDFRGAARRIGRALANGLHDQCLLQASVA